MAFCPDGARVAAECASADVIENAAKIRELISFGTDPMGYLAQKVQTGAYGLATGVLPALREATSPDLSLDWFVSAYRVSFALAIFVWAALLGWNFLQYSRRRVSGDELLDSLVVYSPLFIIGAMFGPIVGQVMVRFVGALTDDIIAWGIGTSAQNTTKALAALIGTGDPNAMMGGAIVAFVLFLFLIVGLLMALVVLVVMLVTLYLTGVVFPLGWVWMTKAGDRSKGQKLLLVWAGVLFAQPLLFFMLGVAMNLATGAPVESFAAGSGPLKTLVALSVAIVALFTATMSPAALMKFAPVGPTDASPGGPGMGKLPTGKGGGSSWRGGAGGDSASDGQLAQVARSSADRGGAEAGASGGGWGGLGGSNGGLLRAASGGGGGAAGSGAGAAGGAAGGTAGAAGGAAGGTAAGAKAGAAAGPVGAVAGAALAGAASKAREGASKAGDAAGEAAGDAASPSTPGATAHGQDAATATPGAGAGAEGSGPGLASLGGDPAREGGDSTPTGPADPAADTSGMADAAQAGDTDDGTEPADGEGGWPTGPPDAADRVPDPTEPSKSGGRLRGALGTAASAGLGAMSGAAKATNTIAGVAAAATAFAEEHMDHHRDGQRARR